MLMVGVFAKEEDIVRDNADVDFYRQWYDEALNKGMHTKLLDAQPKSKQSTIQVVGLGLGRTGSTSVALALGKLGFLSIHDDEQPDLAEEFWAEEVGAITKDQLHQLFGTSTPFSFCTPTHACGCVAVCCHCSIALTAAVDGRLMYQTHLINNRTVYIKECMGIMQASKQTITGLQNTLRSRLF